MLLSVREIQPGDIDLITDYWLNASGDQLRAMGADHALLPGRDDWRAMLLGQIATPAETKISYCLIWLHDGQPIGHCNINKIVFGKEAFMHLHLWTLSERARGSGTALIRLSLPFFFGNFHLQTLYCEPYALNPAPNRTLEKTGFTLIKSYIATPGSINFEQPVNLWALTAADFLPSGKKINGRRAVSEGKGPALFPRFDEWPVFASPQDRARHECPPRKSRR